jgi:glycine cleavage system P protein (glycine dehydrogenase) subunit 2
MSLEPTIFELSKAGRRGVRFPNSETPERSLPVGLEREQLDWPELSEIDVVRHFTRLSQKNHAIDVAIYPLGSCTMKFNPRINEEVSRLPGLAFLHPLQSEETSQGALRLMYELQEMLDEISGFAAVTLQPAAGAHGELTGVLIMRAWHHERGDDQRNQILVPDSAHGTNPATAVMGGFQVVTIPSDSRGNVDIGALSSALGERTAGIMITNPNTLGLWDEHIEKVIAMVHEVGGLVYNDGANFNAILSYARPGDLGIDIMHFNLHKTFSTPHGGGGPGSGPVGVREELSSYLPGPIVRKLANDTGDTYTWSTPEKSIGRLHSFHGNFGMFVRAHTYIRMHGEAGLRGVSTDAVLNANYLKARLSEDYDIAYDRSCMHEVVFSARRQKQRGVRAVDIAKRLLDFGVHPPTTYFPLTVPEALMIEPTETESKESLDHFADALLQIAAEASTEPDKVTGAPHTTEFRRLDEAGANRKLDLKWQAAKHELVAAD